MIGDCEVGQFANARHILSTGPTGTYSLRVTDRFLCFESDLTKAIIDEIMSKQCHGP